MFLLFFQCHKSRSQADNRKEARLMLEEKLDFSINGDKSYIAQLEKERSNHQRDKKNKNKKRLALKKAFKEREGLD